jgi:hypothetical protein
VITNLPATLRGAGFKENVDMDELISKKAVIEAIEKARANVGHNLERSIGKSIIEILDDVGRDVNGLPSALGTNLAEAGTDLISRQTLLDKFEPWLKVKDYNDGELNMLKAILYEIRFMRSAQPEIIRCRECKFASGDSRICMKFDHSPIGELDFCSFAERREVNNESN